MADPTSLPIRLAGQKACTMMNNAIPLELFDALLGTGLQSETLSSQVQVVPDQLNIAYAGVAVIENFFDQCVQPTGCSQARKGQHLGHFIGSVVSGAQRNTKCSECSVADLVSFFIEKIHYFILEFKAGILAYLRQAAA